MINLHIIGVQKAGTSALASFLQQHPAIYVVDGKEAHVFDHPHYVSQADKTAFAKDKFRHRMRNYQGQPWLCDASPITIYRETFVRECYRYNPDARFIVILRDPVERAISHYHMSRNRGQETRSMLFAFLFEYWRIRRSKKQLAWPFKAPVRTFSYLSRGLYTRQLRRLYAIVPEQQVLVIQQEALQQDHRKTLLQIFEFLDIHRVEIPQQSVFRTDKNTTHWSDAIARGYARLYFWLHNLTSRQPVT